MCNRSDKATKLVHMDTFNQIEAECNRLRTAVNVLRTALRKMVECQCCAGDTVVSHTCDMRGAVALLADTGDKKPCKKCGGCGTLIEGDVTYPGEEFHVPCDCQTSGDGSEG